MGHVAEALAARRAGLIDADQLVARLAAARIRPPREPAAAGPDGYAAAESWAPPAADTWDEIVAALDTGALTWAEYEALSARVESETPSG